MLLAGQAWEQACRPVTFQEELRQTHQASTGVNELDAEIGGLEGFIHVLVSLEPELNHLALLRERHDHREVMAELHQQASSKFLSRTTARIRYKYRSNRLESIAPDPGSTELHSLSAPVQPSRLSPGSLPGT